MHKPDPRELFVPSSNHYEMIQLRRNWPAVLPCQVTSPEAKVTLHREFPPGEVSVDGTEISFNNRKGFTIHRPQLHHAGVMQCVAMLGNLRQSSTKYILIYVNCEHRWWVHVIMSLNGAEICSDVKLKLWEDFYFLSQPLDPIAPPAPVIKASSSSVTVGDNLRVTCAAAGERDVLIEFNWEYPGQQVRDPI